MAYMNQERKMQLAALVRKVIPSDWKHSLAVRNHSTIVLTIRQAPVDLLQDLRDHGFQLDVTSMHASLSRHTLVNYLSPAYAGIFSKVFDALHTGNHDNSDITTDYFDVGWYVDVQIGEWGNPFLHVLPPKPGTNAFIKKQNKLAGGNAGALNKKYGTGLKQVSSKVKKKGIEFPAISYYLPPGWQYLTPGKKAAATKKAMKMAGLA